MIEREYWKKAEEGLTVHDYPDPPEELLVFPKEIPISFAVCSKECGKHDFIVDGGSQICEYCGKSRFRIVSRWYVLTSEPHVPTRPGGDAGDALRQNEQLILDLESDEHEE
jgi:hypothetical protein